MYEEDFNKLFEDHKLLIYKFLSNKRIDGQDKDDLIQECMMILNDCNKNYDPSKKTKFSTYFYVTMRNRIVDLILKQNYDKRPDIIFVDSDSPILLNKISNDNVELNDKNTRLFAEIVNELLTYKRGEITYYIYVMGMTKREVAELEGVSEQRIGALNKRNIKKLRDFLKNRGLVFDSENV